MREPKPKLGTERLPTWFWPLALVVVCLSLYGRTVGFAYTNWDDDPLLTDNPLLQPWSWSSLLQLFQPSAIPQEQLYIPLTYLTHWVEISLAGGPSSAVTHVVNGVLHTVNVLLVFVLLKRLGVVRMAAGFGALVFAVHPLQVEAVAWGMGRKDLLSTLFALLALLAWWHWRRYMRQIHYAAAVGLYLAAMLAKPSMIVLPGVFVLLDFYQGAPVCRRTVLEKAPLVSIGLAVFFIQPGTARTAADAMPLGYRFACLPWVVKDWVLRTAAVEQPCAFHPWPDHPAWLLLTVGLPVLFVLGTALWLAVWFHRTPLWFGLAFILITALPAFTLILMYRKFITADRYAYFPLVGVVFLLAMVIDTWRPALRPVMSAAFCVWLGWLGASSWLRIGEWRNSRILWEATTQRAPEAHHAWLNLGTTLEAENEILAAAEAYDEAVMLEPEFAAGWRHLAGVQLKSGRLEAAVSSAEKAAALLSPVSAARERAKALQTFGAASYRLERFESAAAAYKEVETLIRPTPANQLGYGLTLTRMGRYRQAERRFRKTLELDPDREEAYAGLALCLQRTERPDQANELFLKLRERNPDSPFLPKTDKTMQPIDVD